MGKIANMIGSSGLVGKQLVEQLLDHPEIELIRIFTRRASGLNHPKIEEQIIDFNRIDDWRMLVQGDVLFSSLGTTIKAAKTKANQYLVDYTYQFEFARAAAENGVPVYVLVSSIGANSSSGVFYSRIKGELENAVKAMGFKKLVIFRPSILDGDRQEKRAGEKFGLMISRFITRFILKKYKPTPVDVLAAKMIRLALQENEGEVLIEGLEIFRP